MQLLNSSAVVASYLRSRRILRQTNTIYRGSGVEGVHRVLATNFKPLVRDRPFPRAPGSASTFSA